MPETLMIDTSSGSYPVYLGERLLTQLGELLTPLFTGTRLLIVTDEHVAPHYLEQAKQSLEAAGYSCSELILPPGEQTKSPDMLLRLYDACSAAGISRRDGLVALGGGVIGDIAGYAAATWLRGTHYIQVPTTLLAQVDSSVGGKTAIDLPQGKNLVGAFKQPLAVIADTATLDTLPPRELAAGMAEVVKYGFIRDAELWDQLRAHGKQAPDQALIGRCIRIKAEVVAQDEFDLGLRAILNFGHSYGHAIEAIQGYSDWRHGEAVACGMVLALRLSELTLGTDPQLRHDLSTWLTAWGLPTHTDIPAAQLSHALRADKKSSNDSLNAILIPEAGRASIHLIPLAELDELTPQLLHN